ncbi:hypothetical protein B6U66_02475 [Candidatus Bathyarchaeota archaeon ex4484_135]|nr:MAG: hypothetical protein B6U66_02475 [Candidatus Bathyarchaeota archaeon ex4484_135]
MLLPMPMWLPGLPQGDLTDLLLSTILILVSMAFFTIFGQRIQAWMMLRQVARSLDRLRLMRDEGRKMAIRALRDLGGAEGDVAEKVDRFLEHFAIEPESMDPAGVVWKLERILDVREKKFLDEVRRMAPKASEDKIHNLEGLLEAAMALNTLYKVVRHYYLLGKKTSSIYIIAQLQMLIPLLMKTARAYADALMAFRKGQPIGDGIGALVAAKLMHGKPFRRIAKDTIVAEVDLDGRKAFVVKAEGPGAMVGKPGEAVRKLVEELDGDVKAVVFVDATIKLEGEKTGEIIDGIGVAIGGPGVEKFKVEELLPKLNIPTYAVLIKEDISEAVSPMKEELLESADRAIERIKALLSEVTEEGDKVVIVGVGNTMGIGQ